MSGKGNSSPKRGKERTPGSGSRACWRRLACFLLLCALPLPLHAGEVTIAAASDLQFALREISGMFQAETGHQVRLSFGSSGNLYAQLRHGAPYDLFFSADHDYPAMLADQGHADPAFLRVYGIGRLVLWTRAPKLDPAVAGMQTLLAPGLRRIAIANPRHAPYGRAAVEAMRHYGVYEKVEKRLIFGENVSQAAQFAESGNAQVGIIALSLALFPAMQDHGRYWLVPEAAHSPLVQAVVIPRSAPQPELAREFFRFVFRPESRAVLQRYGFAPPEAAP